MIQFDCFKMCASYNGQRRKSFSPSILISGQWKMVRRWARALACWYWCCLAVNLLPASSELSPRQSLGTSRGRSSLQLGTPKGSAFYAVLYITRCARLHHLCLTQALLQHPSKLCTCRPSFQILGI